MNLDPTEEQRQIVATVRRFVREEIVPLEAKLDPDASELPAADFERLNKMVREMGFWGLDIPAEYGGAGIDLVTRTLMAVEMAQHRAGLYAPCYGVFGSAGLAQLYEATEEQKQRYLHPMLRGEKRGFFGLTEPSGGSDPARAIRTRAVKDGSDWIINGSKVFISGADKAHFGLVFARTDAEKGRGGITCFIVDTDMKGFHVRRVVHTLRSSHYATELQFEDLRVPHANVLGEVGKGFAIANDRLSRQRIPYAAACIGVAVKAQELAIDYAKQRETFGARARHPPGRAVDDRRQRARHPHQPVADAGRRPQGRHRPALPYGGRHGQAGRQRGRRPGGGPLHADPRRLRHDQGPPLRALVPRDAHPPRRRRPQRSPAPRHRSRSAGRWAALIDGTSRSRRGVDADYPGRSPRQSRIRRSRSAR